MTNKWISLALPLALLTSMIAVPAPAAAVDCLVAGFVPEPGSIRLPAAGASAAACVSGEQAAVDVAADAFACAPPTSVAAPCLLAAADGRIAPHEDAPVLVCADARPLGVCVEPGPSSFHGVMAAGRIVIRDDGLGAGPQVTISGLLSTHFTCDVDASEPIVVTCTPLQAPPGIPDGYWECPAMILTAKAWTHVDGTGALRSGEGHGESWCGSPPNWIFTDDVYGTPASGAGNPVAHTVSSTLGPVDPAVVCVASGVNRSVTPVPPYEVECYEPGVEGVEIEA